jgi:hypothetical protein
MRRLCTSLLFIPLALTFNSCNPIDACIDHERYESELGDTVFVRSCSVNADAYEWLLDEEPPNNYLPQPEPFFSHFTPFGGESCDRYVTFIFSDTGEFTVTLSAMKLKSGNCSAESKPGKSKTAKAKIHISLP